jgi:hypothetical protein
MGKRNTTAQQQETLAWAKAYQGHRTRLGAGTVPRAAAVASGDQLRRYFALAALSRSTTAPQGLVEAAWNEVFRVRVAIEHSIDRSVCDSLTNGAITLREILGGGFFGVSKKQGVSVRMPLLTCRPTRICGAACYAHDVLDAAPAAVVRGVLNGIIARTYEEGTAETRRGVIDKLQPQTRRRNCRVPPICKCISRSGPGHVGGTCRMCSVQPSPHVARTRTGAICHKFYAGFVEP